MTCSFDAQHLIAGLDPGRSKCGLVLADRRAQQIHQAAILSPKKPWPGCGIGTARASEPW